MRPAPPLPCPAFPGLPFFFLPAAGLPSLGLPGEPCPGGLAPKAVARDVRGGRWRRSRGPLCDTKELRKGDVVPCKGPGTWEGLGKCSWNQRH